MGALNLLNNVYLAACIAGLTGCGAELPTNLMPEPTPVDSQQETPVVIATLGPTATPTPTSTPTPSPTVVAYGFNNSAGICAALHNWNPDTTTVEFPTNSGGSFLLDFTWQGVFITNPDHSNPALWAAHTTATITKVTISTTVCVITVTDGQLVSVTP